MNKSLGCNYSMVTTANSTTLLTSKLPRDSPGDPVVKNLPCYAGDSGLIPAQGTKVSHAAEQLSHTPQPKSLWATKKDPTCHSEDLMWSNKYIKYAFKKRD